ncbi:MAG: hypothetical protein RL138_1827 [Bacteroidota bacterium]|jgi:uncharacterized protein YndB with AHSA1/START domain
MAKKKQYSLEYVVRSSPAILYEFLTEPSELALWFADHVDNHNGNYSFTWEGYTDHAELVSSDEDEYVRYRWDYQAKDEYFEFSIKKSDISQDTILTITDFADPKEMKDQQLLWDSQIKSLKKHIGGLG